MRVVERPTSKPVSRSEPTDCTAADSRGRFSVVMSIAIAHVLCKHVIPLSDVTGAELRTDRVAEKKRKEGTKGCVSIMSTIVTLS
jgi:hypothetical protein